MDQENSQPTQENTQAAPVQTPLQPQKPIQQEAPVIQNQTTPAIDAGSKSFMVTYLLSQFFGYLGIDRFYLGKIGTGILKLLTAGGFGIWSFIDVILILVNHTTSADGKKLVGYEQNKKFAVILFILFNFIIPLIFMTIFMFSFGAMIVALSNNKNIQVSTNYTNNLEEITPTESALPTQATTDDDTASWKKFTSEKYNFSIKYPADISPNEVTSPFYFIEFKRSNAQQGERSFYDILASKDTFFPSDPTAYNFLSSDVYNTINLLPQGGTKTYSTVIFTREPDFTINGVTALKVNVESSVDTTTNQTRFYVKKNGNIYLFVNNQSGDQTNFLKLISTFTTN